MTAFRALRDRLRILGGPDRVLCRDVMVAAGAEIGDQYQTIGCWRMPSAGVGWTLGWRDATASVDAARALTSLVLPNFWMSSGLCALSGHASIGPDYNGPAGERLRLEWPEADFHAGFDADLAPGDGPHRECAALLDCMLQALERKPYGGGA